MHTIHAAIKVSLLSYDTDGNHRTDDIVNTLVLATPFYFFNKDKTKMIKCQGKNIFSIWQSCICSIIAVVFDKKVEITQKFSINVGMSETNKLNMITNGIPNKIICVLLSSVMPFEEYLKNILI